MVKKEAPERDEDAEDVVRPPYTPKGGWPKKLGVLADLFGTLKQNRLAMDRAAAEAKWQETSLFNHLIAEFGKDELSRAGGTLYNLGVNQQEIPIFADKKKFFAWVKKTGNLHFLQSRLSVKPIKELWDAGKVVPGVGRFVATKISVTATKAAKAARRK